MACTQVSLLYLVTLQIALAAFQLINSIMPGRAVYYKQKGENFFPPWTYIVSEHIQTPNATHT